MQIDVTDEDHEYADVATADMAKLASATSGAAHILWKETGTGTKWATVRLGKGAGGTADAVIRRAKAQENAQADAYLSVKLLDSGGGETGDAFDVTNIGGRNFTALTPDVHTGDTVLVTEVDSIWYVLNFTPSQSSAGTLVRVTVTEIGGAHPYIAAKLDDDTAIELVNVNGINWENLLPSMKNTSGRDKCFAMQIGGTWYAIPDFANIGKA